MKYLKAHFTDELHDEDIVIANTEGSAGDPLSFELDGIKFAGSSFCDFELADGEQYDEAVNKFCILKYNGYDSKYYYGLQRYGLRVEIPIMLFGKKDGGRTEGILHYSFDMKKPEEGEHSTRSVCDGEDVYWDIIIPHNCSIFVGDVKYDSAVKSSDFESLLESLSESLKVSGKPLSFSAPLV